MVIAAIAVGWWLIAISLPTKIELVPALTTHAGGILSQTFVVRNPPRDREQLVGLVDKYNRATISSKELSSHLYVRRAFYRQTYSLTADYREKSGFLGDSIEAYYEEMLLLVEYRGSFSVGSYNYWENGRQTAYQYFGDEIVYLD